VQCRRGPGDVEWVHHERVRAELVRCAGLAGQDEHAAVVGQDRALLGDQVHAIPDRVDQQHVGEPVARQRARVVVVGAEQDRGPVRRAELVVDRRGEPLHAGRVLAVLGQVVPGRVGQREHHDLAAPLWMGQQQLAVGGKPPDDVLGQLGPVDPDDQLAVPDLLAHGGHPCLHVRLRAAACQLRRVDAERVHADARGVALVVHDLPAPVRLGTQHGLAAVDEGVRPPLAQEARVVGAEYALEYLGGD
jgi:hypothetical protein